jgi:hypothetical protein
MNRITKSFLIFIVYFLCSSCTGSVNKVQPQTTTLEQKQELLKKQKIRLKKLRKKELSQTTSHTP